MKYFIKKAKEMAAKVEEKIVGCSEEQRTNGIIAIFLSLIAFLGITMLVEMR